MSRDAYVYRELCSAALSEGSNGDEVILSRSCC